MKNNKYEMRYTLKIDVREEGYTKEDATDDYHGLCDSFIFVSILKPEDGGYSELILSGNSKDQELSDEDLFKHFAMLSSRLSRSTTLQKWKKEIVTTAFESIQKIVTSR